MSIKKLVLLASALAAMVAFAVPAVSSATVPQWYDHNTGSEPLEEGEERPLHIEGSLSSKTIAGPTSGPCNVTFTGVAENVAGMAAGRVTNGNINGTAACAVPAIPGCTFEGHVNFAKPWPITGVSVTNQTGIEIKEATFTNTYNAVCQAAGLPATVNASGTATGILTANSVNGESCATFNGHKDDMFVEVGGNPTATEVDIGGNVCVTKPLTLK